MKIQTNAVNVLQRTSAYLKSGLLKETPAWYNVVASILPSTKFTREPRFKNPSNGSILGKLVDVSERQHVNKNGLYKTRPNTNDKRVGVKKLYKPPKLTFVEDRLRALFYQQHPWELSRPKILVENEIGDENYDWSHMLQLGKLLDGESVIQRTMYLLKTKQYKSTVEAYDHARYEFYALRMQEDMQQQVALEEAEMFGSIFGTSAIEHGIQKEQEVLDVWERKVIEETELMAARSSNPAGSWKDDTASETAQDGESITAENLHF
ncbi:rsm25p [Saccharomyces arboricola H-6]|uniref:37S ribosomal protein S25, mitochondrial n=1 Tax=Saccharomyces arboricola (strain H-6 / AS 2.3317 / CBS 10644) TaxID=1160507 RepID=J8LMJ8_SACAR|nr:rsm25p [Saccharomyces arboricola H-6]